MSMKLVCEISKSELALRIAEACLDLERPPGQTAEQALLYFDEENRAGFMNAAESAMTYIAECIAKGSPMQ